MVTKRALIGLAAILALLVGGIPDRGGAQESLMMRVETTSLPDTTPEPSGYFERALMSSLGSALGIGGGVLLGSRLGVPGVHYPGLTGALAGAVLGATAGSAWLLSASDSTVPFGPALGASTIGTLGGLATAWMTGEVNSRAFEEGILVVFTISQGLVTAGIVGGMGY